MPNAGIVNFAAKRYSRMRARMINTSQLKSVALLNFTGVAQNPEYWNWRHDADWVEAEVKYWYRRFYSETRTGQLMVLRPDKPILYEYRGADSLWDMELATIRKAYYLLWAVFALLVAIAFLAVKDLMAGVAGAFSSKVLVLAWQTRKGGRLS